MTNEHLNPSSSSGVPDLHLTTPRYLKAEHFTRETLTFHIHVNTLKPGWAIATYFEKTQAWIPD